MRSSKLGTRKKRMISQSSCSTFLDCNETTTPTHIAREFVDKRGLINPCMRRCVMIENPVMCKIYCKHVMKIYINTHSHMHNLRFEPVWKLVTTKKLRTDKKNKEKTNKSCIPPFFFVHRNREASCKALVF